MADEAGAPSHSSATSFELAAVYRDQHQAIDKVPQEQRVVAGKVDRAWIGVGIHDLIPELALALKVPGARQCPHQLDQRRRPGAEGEHEAR